MSSSFEIVECQPVKAAAIRLDIAWEDMKEAFCSALDEITQTLREQSIERQGPCFAYYFKCSETNVDVEVGFPTATNVERSSNNRVYATMSPSGKAAKAMHIGPYEKIYEAWKTFDQSVDAKGLKRRGESIWEVYTVGPETLDDPEKFETELYRPVE